MLIKLTNPEQVDKRKLKLESIFKSQLFSLYKTIANDHKKIIKQYGTIINKDLFIQEHSANVKAILKTIYRKTFKEFGFDLRTAINELTQSIEFDIKKSNQNDIYDDYNEQSLKLINTQADDHTDFIMDTLYAKSLFYFDKANNNYNNDIIKLNNDIQKITNNIQLLSKKPDNRINKLKLQKLQTLLNQTKEKLNSALYDKNNYIANEFEDLFNDNVSQQLANIEATSEVGFAESTSRQLELSLLATSGITLTAQKKTIDFATAFVKEWSATLDNKTRTTHAHAHGQQKKYNERFEVANPRSGIIEYGFTPRDENFSLENKINCRCIMAVSMQF